MKIVSFNVFKSFRILFVIILVVLVIYAVCPFELVDMHQAERIAKWKSEFEQIKYCFALAVMHEGGLQGISGYTEEVADELLKHRIKPYFNFAEENFLQYKDYKYRRRNGRSISKDSRFYFDKFIKNKDGALISFRKNMNYMQSIDQPLFYMFIDINGIEKPNRAGEDIFFAELFTDKIAALGSGRAFSELKQNCSPIGTGVYCSEFYLSGCSF